MAGGTRTAVFEVYGPDDAYITFYYVAQEARDHARRIGGTTRSGWR